MGWMLQPKDKDWLNGYKTTNLYMLSTRGTSKQGTHTDWKWRAGKNISHKWRPKESRSHNTHIRKNRLKIKAVKRDKEEHYIVINGSIQEEDITIISIYAPNIWALQYVGQMLTSMKGEISNNTIIVGDLSNILTHIARSTKQKINKETQTLKDTMDQLDLIDIYRTFHPKTINFTFSQVHTEPSLEEIRSWGINLALVNSKKLKSFQSSFLKTME